MVFPACITNKKDTSKDKKDVKNGNSAQVETNEGAVLCSINGKPVIYEAGLMKSIAQMMQQNPYFKGANIDALPNKLKRQILDKLTDQEIILSKAYQDNITQTEDFKKAYKEMMQLVERSLAIQFFEKNVFEKTAVSDSDIKQHYNANKEKYVKVAGGILVSGAKFTSEALANKFMDTVKAKPADFDKLAAKDKNAKFKHFGRINQAAHSAQQFEAENIPSQIKTKALSASKFPSIDKVTINKDVWVFAALDKKDSVYFDIDEIRPQIEGFIKQNQFAKNIESQLKDLRNEMTIVINEDYFADAQEQVGDEDAKNQQEQQTAQTAETSNPASAA